MHYGGIGAPAVGNIRRRVRQRQIAILPEVDQLLSMIRKAVWATARSVK